MTLSAVIQRDLVKLPSNAGGRHNMICHPHLRLPTILRRHRKLVLDLPTDLPHRGPPNHCRRITRLAPELRRKPGWPRYLTNGLDICGSTQ